MEVRAIPDEGDCLYTEWAMSKAERRLGQLRGCA